MFRNNQCRLFFLFRHHFDRWFFYFFRHFSRYRNFLFFRCFYQKTYANVQKTLFFSKYFYNRCRWKYQKNRYFEQKSFHDRLLYSNFFVFRLRHSNRCANFRKTQTLFVRLFRFESFRRNIKTFRNFISSWTIWFACSLKSRIRLICNDIKCVRFLFVILTNAISQTNVISYKIALRYIFMRRFHLFRNRSNSKHLNQHMFAKTFRVNFRFRDDFRSHLFLFFLFRFAFFFRHFRVHFLFANIVKNVSSFIDLSIESNQMFQKLKTMKYSWKCVIDVSFFFMLFWNNIDFFSKKSLFWKIKTCCLFVYFVR